MKCNKSAKWNFSHIWEVYFKYLKGKKPTDNIRKKNKGDGDWTNTYGALGRSAVLPFGVGGNSFQA